MEDTISLTFKVHGIKQLVTRGGDQIDNMVFNGFYLLPTFIFLFLSKLNSSNQVFALAAGQVPGREVPCMRRPGGAGASRVLYGP